MTTYHPEFYFDDGFAVIKVEKTTFKLHKYKLMTSEFFADKINLRDIPYADRNNEWSFELEGVSVPDFVCLLKVLYANQFSAHQVVAEPSLLIPALRLSHKWGFKELYAHLVELAEIVLDDVDKVALARELDIKEWVGPAHVRLCRRKEPFTADEATKLGIDSLLLIFQLRDKNRPLCSDPAHPRSVIMEERDYDWLEQAVEGWIANGCVLSG